MAWPLSVVMRHLTLLAYQPQCWPANWLRNRCHFAPGYCISCYAVDIASPGPDTIFDYHHLDVVANPSMIDFGVVMIDPMRIVVRDYYT